MNIMFVCTGNTCRSAMAEAILKNKLKENEKKAKYFLVEYMHMKEIQQQMNQ